MTVTKKSRSSIGFSSGGSSVPSPSGFDQQSIIESSACDTGGSQDYVALAMCGFSSSTDQKITSSLISDISQMVH